MGAVFDAKHGWQFGRLMARRNRLGLDDWGSPTRNEGFVRRSSDPSNSMSSRAERAGFIAARDVSEFKGHAAVAGAAGAGGAAYFVNERRKKKKRAAVTKSDSLVGLSKAWKREGVEKAFPFMAASALKPLGSAFMRGAKGRKMGAPKKPTGAFPTPGQMRANQAGLFVNRYRTPLTAVGAGGVAGGAAGYMAGRKNDD